MISNKKISAASSTRDKTITDKSPAFLFLLQRSQNFFLSSFRNFSFNLLWLNLLIIISVMFRHQFCFSVVFFNYSFRYKECYFSVLICFRKEFLCIQYYNQCKAFACDFYYISNKQFGIQFPIRYLLKVDLSIDYVAISVKQVEVTKLCSVKILIGEIYSQPVVRKFFRHCQGICIAFILEKMQ